MNSSISGRYCLVESEVKNHFNTLECPKLYVRLSFKKVSLKNMSIQEQQQYHLSSNDMIACSSNSFILSRSLEYSFEKETRDDPQVLDDLSHLINKQYKQDDKSKWAIESALTLHNNMKVLYVKGAQKFIYFDQDEEQEASRKKLSTAALVIGILIALSVLVVTINILYVSAKSAFSKLVCHNNFHLFHFMFHILYPHAVRLIMLFFFFD